MTVSIHDFVGKHAPSNEPFRGRRWRSAVLIVTAAGVPTAALVGVALAKTSTLQVALKAKEMKTMGMTIRENIVVNSRGRAA